jgi:hypothetical protein
MLGGGLNGVLAEARRRATRGEHLGIRASAYVERRLRSTAL